MKIAITGHRPNKLGNDYELKSPLAMWIKREIEDKVADQLYGKRDEEHTLISGMALGIDTLFAKIAVEMKIPFIAAIPFKGQEGRWPIHSKNLYYELLQKAQSIQVVDINVGISWMEYQKLPYGLYLSQKMDQRNKWMVDNCDKLIAVWDGTGGGTYNCVTYAQQQIGRPDASINELIRISPKDFK